MTLAEKRDELLAKSTAFAKKLAEGEALTEEEQQEFDGLKAATDDVISRMKSAEEASAMVKSLGTPALPAKEDTFTGEQTPSAKSIGDYFVQGAKSSGVLTRLKSGNRVNPFDMPEFTGSKAAGDVIKLDNLQSTASHLVTPDIDRNIVTTYAQRPTIASWLGSGTITSNAIVYFVEKVWDDSTNGTFGMIAEGADKPGMTPPDYTEVTEVLKKLAGWIKLSMEMAEDAEFLVSEINNRLLFQLLVAEEAQLLNGDGTGQKIKGLLNREGVQKKNSANAAGNLDAVYESMNAVFTKTGLRADGIVINPADYEKFRLQKDSNGQYLAGGPFTGQYGVGGILQDPPLWGLNTIQTTSIPAGKVLIGAGQAAATVYRKGGIRVETSNADRDDFTKNQFTILAEERLALAVRRPDAFVELTLGS
jgi:phage capsid family